MNIARWFGRAASLVVVSSVCLLAVPGCSGADGEEVCEKVNALCTDEQSTSDPDSGVSVSVTASCDAKQADEFSNLDEISDCLDSAKDCGAALTCVAKAKK